MIQNSLRFLCSFRSTAKIVIKSYCTLHETMASSGVQEKCLLAFDFDHTVVDENSDLYVRKLAPGGKIPDEIKDLYRDDGWTLYMSEIFRYLHENGTTPHNILSCMSEINLVEGIDKLLEFTSKGNNFDHIIISDSNSVFISHILEKKNLSSAFLKIFTNPAKFLESGLLTLKGYHQQNWCSLSSDNLCKGHILKSFIEKQKDSSINYSHIFYIGDGFNDLCPGLTLGEKDYLLPRIDFRLHSLIDDINSTNTPVPKSQLKATVVPWRTGFDILKLIQTDSTISDSVAGLS